MFPQDKDNLGEQLSAYLDGELSDAETAEVERLVAADPQAREMLEAFRRTVETVRALPRQSAPDSLLDDLTARVERAQLLDGMPEPTQPVRGTHRSTWGLLASAAIVIFAVGGGFWAFTQISDKASHPGKQIALDEQEDATWSAEKPEDAPGSAGLRRREPAPVPPTKQKAEAKTVESDEADAAPKLGLSLRKKIAVRERGPLVPESRTSNGEMPRSEIEAQQIAATPTPAPAKELHATRAEPAREGCEQDLVPVRQDAGLALAAAESPHHPHDPLEMRLRRGVTLSDVLEHPFANETNNLYVSFSSVPDRDAAEGQVTAFLAGKGMQALDDAVVESGAPIPPSATFFVEGQARRNYRGMPDDRQLLVRLPAAQLAALVQEAGAASGYLVTLEMGRPASAGQGGAQAKLGEERVASAEGSSGRRGRGGRVAGSALPGKVQKGAFADAKDARGTIPPSRDQEPSKRKLTPPQGGLPDAGTNGGELADTEAEVITVVINLRAPPRDATGDELVRPPTTQPATTQPATSQSTITKP